MKKLTVLLSTIIILLIFNLTSAKSFNPKIVIKKYNPDLAFNGTTMFPLSKLDAETANNKNTIIEIDMLGNIVWEYVVPSDVVGDKRNNMGDVEYLPNGNILFQVHGLWTKKGERKSLGSGNFEITRDGEIVWSYKDTGASHDIDRLENGNTIWVRGWAEKGEPHVIEVNLAGEVVWQWDAMEEFDVEPYSKVSREGWIHVNAVTRLENGNTLISLRNFDMVVEVNPQGKVVWSQKFFCDPYRWVGLWSQRGIDMGYDLYDDDDYPPGCNPHEPEIQSNGNMLVSVRMPFKSYELTREGEIVWEVGSEELHIDSRRSRDVDRLPNGNTLVQVESMLYEVTPEKEIVWFVDFPEIMWFRPSIAKRMFSQEPKSFWKQFIFKGLYKAQRIAPE